MHFQLFDLIRIEYIYIFKDRQLDSQHFISVEYL